jgi:BirA family transcriptional regulator, biotin operon repressor / biotin---[acetyl-CoA-carboxylase] ligase
MSTKDQLLGYLKEGQGTALSGEFLGKRLNISRAAIWKHIVALREDGYIIQSSPKKGYILTESPDCLFENEIRDGLKAGIFGKSHIYHYDTTGSTNVMAEHFANEGAPEGAIVVAECQTRGKGRKGRLWSSPAGKGIYVSFILRPPISPNEAPKLTLMASVAFAEAIRECTRLNAEIKWPNDILIGGKKVAGILTEIKAEMDRIHHVVIGVGINVNTPPESFPADILDKATSLYIESGKTVSRTIVLRSCLEHLEKYYEMVKSQGFASVMKRWKELSMMIGSPVRVEVIDDTYTGTVKDISEDGYLIIRDQDGRLRQIISGDVFLLSGGKR